MTEREKMLAGELYDARDPELQTMRRRARLLIHELNASRSRGRWVRSTSR